MLKLTSTIPKSQQHPVIVPIQWLPDNLLSQLSSNWQEWRIISSIIVTNLGMICINRLISIYTVLKYFHRIQQNLFILHTRRSFNLHRKQGSINWQLHPILHRNIFTDLHVIKAQLRFWHVLVGNDPRSHIAEL